MGFTLEGCTGDIYQCSVWNWRPVHYIICEVSQASGLLSMAELRLMADNSGFQVSPEKSLVLGDLIQEYVRDLSAISGKWPDWFNLPCEDFRVNEQNHVITKEQLREPDGLRNSVTPYRVSSEKLNEFIEFCKMSKGFNIY